MWNLIPNCATNSPLLRNKAKKDTLGWLFYKKRDRYATKENLKHSLETG